MKRGKSKKALSEIVGYVLLIMIAVSLSVLVYAWIKNMLPKENVECPEGVSISLADYSCDLENKKINLKIKNNGLFDVYGVFVRVGNVSEGQAVYSLKEKSYNEIYFADKLSPNEVGLKKLSYKEFNEIKKISIQPFIFDKGLILCDKAVISQDIEDCE